MEVGRFCFFFTFEKEGQDAPQSFRKLAVTKGLTDSRSALTVGFRKATKECKRASDAQRLTM